MNFATLQGLTIPEGVVTQIADASGRVLWKKETSKPAILKVAKQTLTTYAGETSYADEQFILLNIYPKTNGTVKVTYGGLTKTITDTSGVANPNAKSVFFGTFNGVSDDVATPASGELTIEGAYSNFAVGSYQDSSKATASGRCGCITSVVEWGDVTSIVDYAFNSCANLVLTSFPSGLTSIGAYAFVDCHSVSIAKFPEGLISIGNYAFKMSTNTGAMSNTSVTLPSTLESVGTGAFIGSAVSGSAYLGYIKEFVMLSKTPPSVTADSFGGEWRYTTSTASNKQVVKIVVPKGCGEVYKSADVWSNHVDQIVEAS